MFGYVTANISGLNEDQKKLYKSCYCGLCKCLNEKYGFRGQMSLSYDMTFLVMLLTSVYGKEMSEGEVRCVPHPIHKHRYSENCFTEYAADMNVLMTYYKLIDDLGDDRSLKSAVLAPVYKKFIPSLEKKYPHQCRAAFNAIRDLSIIERTGDLNPDTAAKAFSLMTRELFVYEEDEHAPALRTFGSKLGEFIYIADACVDLKKDIKKERYNPLISMPNRNFDDILTLIISECTEEYDRLDAKGKYVDILRNILYSGVWVRYNYEKSREEKRGKK